MPELVEYTGRIEILSPMRPGMRVVLGLMGFFPLIAPYELIVRVGWESYANVFFAFAAFVSVGAMAVSGFLFFAAVAGLSSRLVFDAENGTLAYSAAAPVVPLRTVVYPMSDIESVEVGTREWSDGSPSYHVRVVLAGGKVLESGSAWVRGDVEAMVGRVREFVEAAALRRPQKTRVT